LSKSWRDNSASAWAFDLSPSGFGTITYNGEPVYDVHKVVITCEASGRTTAQLELGGIRVQANLAAVEATRKVEVAFSVGAGTGTVTQEDLDIIQGLSAKYGFSLGRLVHALAYLKVILSQDVTYLEAYCARAQEEEVEVDFLVHRDGTMLKKLEGTL